jgi:DNA-binding GntR family transcriptional regulator
MNLTAPTATAPAHPCASARPLHQEVSDRLRDLITEGALAPGEKLNERVLADRLGISRTPLREALKYLASEGLVELLPNRGAIVAPLDPKRLHETFTVLGTLEGLAGELACAQASEAAIREIRAIHFQMLAHHARGELAEYFRCNQEILFTLVAAAGYEVRAEVHRALNAHARRARYMANLTHERWDRAIEEHNLILDALTKRDPGRLRELLREHLANKFVMVREAFGAAPDGA